MAESQAQFNKENVIYQEDIARKSENFQKEIQEAIQNAQLEMTAKQANISNDVQLALQNAINNFQHDVQEYQSTLAKYQAEIGASSQQFATSLQVYQAEFGANVQTYQAEIAGLQIKLQQCQAMYQEAIQLEFQISLQADVLDKQGA